ncbi:MAG TPA: DegV family protein [Candidatus Choladousia intestinipullorum]|nr:DegV family protein [Candidatus Choladousia intestinipullorum]
MGDYLITTDNMTDFPEEYIKEHDLPMMSLTYFLDGVMYTAENSLSSEEFYKKMREGCMPTTSQVNPEEAKEKLLQFLQLNKNIIHIAFSSGLSGTCNSVRIAAQELSEEIPDCRITVVDSLAASLGEGLLVHKALEKQKAGLSYDEMVNWLEENKLRICHNFTVDDLFHLYRGGRVSKAAAVLGTMINLKPVLHVDDEGHLIPLSKVRGRKKSLNTLVDNMEKQMGSYREENDIVFISHGDCYEDALYVQEQVKKRFGIERFLINPVGPTIGAHSGPGTLALFFMGEKR